MQELEKVTELTDIYVLDTSSLDRNGKAQNDAVDRLNSENSDFDRKN